MFKPAEMRKVKVLILDEYLEGVMRELSKAATFHMVDVGERTDEWEGVTPVSMEEVHSRCNEILRRVNQLIGIWDVRREADDAEYIKSRVKEMMEEKTTRKRLDDINDDLEDVEKSALHMAEKIDEIDAKISKLEGSISELVILDRFSIDYKLLESSQILYSVAGILEGNNIKALDDPPAELNDEYVLSKFPLNGDFLLVITTTQANKEVLDQFLLLLNFRRFSAYLEGVSLKDMEDELSKTKDERRELRSKLKDLGKEHRKDMLVWREILGREKQIIDAENLLGKTERVYALEGWVPTKEVDDLTRRIRIASKGCAVIHIYEPTPYDKIPISFENPKIFKPFESIVEMFGLPSYSEIDPTPILAITFPLIFGLMFGDVGHGAILVLGGLGMIRLGRDNKSYQNYGMILLYCGIFAILFGFLYGSIFGYEDVLSKLYESLDIGREKIIHHQGHEETIRILWKSPPHEMEEMIGIAIFVGVIHMSIGLILSAANKVREAGPKSILHSAGKLCFFWGEVAIITAIFKFKIPVFIDIITMYPLEGILSPIILLGICVPIGMMLVGELIHKLHPLGIKKTLGTIGDCLFEVFETFSMFLSNTISYSRILILALVHAMMCAAIIMIAEMLGFPLDILILILGTALIMVLEGLIVFIHTIRLHFYEWFTKFYGAEGVKYKPFVVKEDIPS